MVDEDVRRAERFAKEVETQRSHATFTISEGVARKHI